MMYKDEWGGYSTHLYQIGFQDKKEAEETLKRVIAKRGEKMKHLSVINAP